LKQYLSIRYKRELQKQHTFSATFTGIIVATVVTL